MIFLWVISRGAIIGHNDWAYWEFCGLPGVQRSEFWDEDVPDGVTWISEGSYEI